MPIALVQTLHMTARLPNLALLIFVCGPHIRVICVDTILSRKLLHFSGLESGSEARGWLASMRLAASCIEGHITIAPKAKFGDCADSEYVCKKRTPSLSPRLVASLSAICMSLVETSAFRSTRRRQMSTRPSDAALIHGVHCPRSRALTSALWLRRREHRSRCPLEAANINGVHCS